MKKNIIFLFTFNVLLNNVLLAEPFVVHEYADTASISVNEDSRNFYENEEYSTHYKIKKNDSLSGILNKFYGTNNLNLNVVKSAVLLKNKHAFVRNNANFMFANKRLYLPSVKEIKNLVYKNINVKNKVSKNFTREQEIYFFGN